MQSKKYIDDNIKFRILEAPLMDEKWIPKYGFQKYGKYESFLATLGNLVLLHQKY